MDGHPRNQPRDQHGRDRPIQIGAARSLWGAVDEGHIFIDHSQNTVTGSQRMITPGAVVTAVAHDGPTEVLIEEIVADRIIDGFPVRTARYTREPWAIAVTKLSETQKSALYRAHYETGDFGALPAGTEPTDIGRLAELGLVTRGYGSWPWVLTAGGCSAAMTIRDERTETARVDAIREHVTELFEEYVIERMKAFAAALGHDWDDARVHDAAYDSVTPDVAAKHQAALDHVVDLALGATRPPTGDRGGA